MSKLYAFKLSSGRYYRSGHLVGQQLYLADIVSEDDLDKILRTSIHIKMNIDPDFKLTEVIIKEKVNGSIKPLRLQSEEYRKSSAKAAQD